MKKIYTILAPLCMAVLSLTSCLSDEKVETSPECAIISFSVSDIKSSVTVKNANGNDTTVTKTISGSDIKFNIDQLNGRIYCIDSLPSWTNLSRVVPNFSASGYVYGQTQLENSDSLYYYITSGSDSIDLRKPLSVYVVSTDGMSKKEYTWEMYKKESVSDTIVWEKHAITTKFGTTNHYLAVGNNVCVFYDKDGESYVSKTTNGVDWTTSKTENIKSETVLTINKKMFALGNDSYIYSSDDAVNWTKASAISVNRLLAADKYYLYAFDGNNIIGAKLDNLDSWDVYGSEDVDKLPTSNIASYSVTSKTNKSLEMVTMVGLTENNTSNGVAWYKVSSADQSSNQSWSYTNVSSQNLYKFPYLEGMSTTLYDDAIFAIGKINGTYNNIYRSDDYGISWHTLTDNYPLPTGLNDVDGSYASIVTVNGELWIIKDNIIWKGRMN